MGAKPVETLDTDNYEFLKTQYSGPKHPIFRAETSDIQGRDSASLANLPQQSL